MILEENLNVKFSITNFKKLNFFFLNVDAFVWHWSDLIWLKKQIGWNAMKLWANVMGENSRSRATVKIGNNDHGCNKLNL